MEVATSETEAASTILALDRPGNDRGLLFFEDHLLHIGVAGVRAFTAIHGLRRSQRG